MAKKPKGGTDENILELLTNILIAQLAAAGVEQRAIREVVGCDINRVSRIAKHITAARKTAKGTTGAK